VWLLFFYGIIWSVKNAQNNLVFNEVVPDWDDIYHSCFYKVAYWAKCGCESFFYTRTNLPYEFLS
jgi:hypothetical protein